MTAEVFDVSWFKLEENSDSSPNTGIKINTNGINNYQAQSTFRFTDNTASKDSSLTDIVLSTGKVDEDNPENSTYKEYELTPEFDKDTLNYELELLENIDTMDLTVTKSDENATMKIKVPKRDDDGNLVYDTDGTTIIYEEKEIEDKISTEITLNRLGEPDTNITIIVTAEDGTTTSEYNITIKRPHGTIKGSIYTEPTKTTTKKSQADIKLFKYEDTESLIDWDTAVNLTTTGKSDNLHEALINIGEIQKQATNDDGTYEIKVIPGQYVVLVDKPGYLDHIYLAVTVEKDATVEFEKKDLVAGDINKNGLVEILDKVIMTKQNGKTSVDEGFNADCDINEDGSIQILDKTILTKNNGQKRQIVDYRGGK